jgi:hypothetical protein
MTPEHLGRACVMALFADALVRGHLFRVNVKQLAEGEVSPGRAFLLPERKR